MEAEHKPRVSDFKLYEAAECNAQHFIIAVVDDTWIHELKDSDTYTEVTTQELLDYLQSVCGGLHALDVLTLQNEMQRYHLEAEGIPEYINSLEDAQKRAKRAKNPITDEMLVIIATNAMLSTVQFPWANDEWEDLDPSSRTWKA